MPTEVKQLVGILLIVAVPLVGLYGVARVVRRRHRPGDVASGRDAATPLVLVATLSILIALVAASVLAAFLIARALVL
jgi:hypothetical protein